jgi:hypothetical protein
MARQIVGDNLRIKFTTSVLASLSHRSRTACPRTWALFALQRNYSIIELLGLSATSVSMLSMSALGVKRTSLIRAAMFANDAVDGAHSCGIEVP